MDSFLALVSMGFEHALDSLASLFALAFCVVTNVAASTAPFTQRYRQALHGPQLDRLLLIADAAGEFIRCLIIVVVCFVTNAMPALKLVSGLVLLGFAVTHTLGIRSWTWGAEGATYSRLQAMAGIAACAIVVNVDNILASPVDVSGTTIIWAMGIYMVLYLALRATPLGGRALDGLQARLSRWGHPRAIWNRQSRLRKLIAIGVGWILFVVLSPLFIPGWRALKALGELADDLFELSTAVWVFILVMLACVSIADSDMGLRLTGDWARLLTVRLKDLVAIDVALMRDIVKWVIGTYAAILASWVFLPVIVRRSQSRRRDTTAPQATAAPA